MYNKLIASLLTISVMLQLTRADVNISWADTWDVTEIIDKAHFFRRLRRAVGPLQNIVGQIQVMKECCTVPALTPSASITRCNAANGGSAGVFQPVQTRKASNTPAPKQAAQVKKASNSQQIINSMPTSGGLFSALFSMFGGQRRQKRQDTPPPDMGHNPYAPDTPPPGYYPAADTPPPGYYNTPPPGYYPAADTPPPGYYNTPPPGYNPDTPSSAPQVVQDQNATPPPAIRDTEMTTSWQASTAQQLHSFGIQSVCFTDCIFRDMKVLNEKNNLMLEDMAHAFAVNLMSSAPKGTTEQWQIKLYEAISACADPTLKATPGTVLTNGGRLCSTRPIIMMTCIRRYLIEKCPSINKSQKCGYTRTVLRNANIFNLG